jgi:hypothetical protein
VYAIISNMSLMPPPPPRADIILEPDPAETDENTEDSASIEQDERSLDVASKEAIAASGTPSLSPKEPDRVSKNWLLTPVVMLSTKTSKEDTASSPPQVSRSRDTDVDTKAAGVKTLIEDIHRR